MIHLVDVCVCVCVLFLDTFQVGEFSPFSRCRYIIIETQFDFETPFVPHILLNTSGPKSIACMNIQ